MPAKPIWRDLAMKTLREHGPMTKEELAEFLHLPLTIVSATIKSARHRYPEKFFRAVGYKRPEHGHGDDVMIYAAEPGPDKPRPDNKRARHLKTQANYRDRNRASINARLRARRARIAGKAPAVNVWAALAPTVMQSAMTKNTMRQITHGV